MNSRDEWESALDADPSSMELRFLYADWLEERGEWDGPVVREMAERGLWPSPPGEYQGCDDNWSKAKWNWFRPFARDYPKHSTLSDDEYNELEVFAGIYTTRREAEEDLRVVIYRLALKKVEV